MPNKTNKLQQQVFYLHEKVNYLLEKHEFEHWLDSADVKQLLNCSESTLYRLRKQNAIPVAKIGGKYKYPKSVLDAMLLQGVMGRSKLK